MPSFTSYHFREEDIPKPLGYRRDVHIIMHLSNQVNDDIKATVREDTELQVEDEQLPDWGQLATHCVKCS